MRCLDNYKRPLSFICLAVFAVFFLAACGEPAGQDNREKAVEVRESTYSRANSIHPVIPPQNFPIREALVEFTVRQDMINHPWYIYLLGMNGEPYGYYVGKTYPISTCNFLSSSEIVDQDSEGKVVLTAPSLDGIFYGGAGASAACQSMFFFDVTTNAMITFSSPQWFASDVPLQLDVPRINADPAQAQPDASDQIDVEPTATATAE